MGRIEISKKIGDSKGTFHAKMGTIKDRNGKDITEAEKIKKRQQEYTCGEHGREKGSRVPVTKSFLFQEG